ncbi:ATPase [Burkholderia seminalis]|nr:ATPase [Burkholderia seminalis]
MLSDVTVLFVVLRPVEAEVDNDVIELLADDRPVDAEVLSDDTVLFVVLRPVEADVDSE